MNILLDNYNEITIKDAKFVTSKIFGNQPYAYDKNEPVKRLFGSEILNSRQNGSVSPCDRREQIRTPLNLKKIKSQVGKNKSQVLRKNYYDRYLPKSPLGILYNLAERRKVPKANPFVDSDFRVTDSDGSEADCSSTHSGPRNENIDFNNTVTVKHGSKKLIEEIDDTCEGPSLANKTR